MPNPKSLVSASQQQRANKVQFDATLPKINALGNAEAIRTMLGPDEQRRLYVVLSKASPQEISYMAWLAAQGRNGEVAAMEAQIAQR
jgi:hypothetical protein